ncbi:unnamed protein product [Mycetohabitans rhizoxinica HKI 454]|uniref:Uncharacterized protein n=1 Tax=Mycetohabitans rhizoxinica (strain DSM 19002 / CIP 109453 / HKI 454) TaxID=882378 RepID=E5ANN7_MYCRK|nr:unnamed protein product [Mycetohabitans rhizoxinica HKI 454]
MTAPDSAMAHDRCRIAAHRYVLRRALHGFRRPIGAIRIRGTEILKHGLPANTKRVRLDASTDPLPLLQTAALLYNFHPKIEY